MMFLGRVAYNAWPEAVIVICLMFGVIMSLQFLVYGVHWCVRHIADGVRLMIREVTRICGGGPAAPPPPYEPR